MKTRITSILLGLLAAAMAQNEGNIIVVEREKTPPPPPLIFAASVNTVVDVQLDAATVTSRIDFRTLQGKPDTFTLPLIGEGEVTSVVSEGIRDWSVRRDGDGARFLDVRPALPDEPPFPAIVRVTVTATTPVTDGRATPLLTAPGDAAGYDLALAVNVADGVHLNVARAAGLARSAGAGVRFSSVTRAELALDVAAKGLAINEVKLNGQLAEDGSAVRFSLEARAVAAAAGARTVLLTGAAALRSGVAGDGWHIALSDGRYELVAEREGELNVRMEFDARVARSGDWRRVEFFLHGGVVVPVSLAGFPERARFATEDPLVPRREGDGWVGNLPADGSARFAWRDAKTAVAVGSLFFASTVASDIHVGGGLLRQSTSLGLQVLQGRLDSLVLELTGPGEVLSVTGAAITGWTVREGEDDTRLLEVRLSRPIEGSAELKIESQTALGPLPVTTSGLRIAPRGALRHSGHLRVAGMGAVRVEVRDAAGLIQLAPGQFPGGELAEDTGVRQSFVYRFPAAAHDFTIHASQVAAETGVSEITIYELGESDRRIHADIELDIREAPLREWEIVIPAGHAVAAVTGAAVVDFTTAATPLDDGRRLLTVIFASPIQGRHLISLRLERNAGPQAGAWELPPLEFPAARSRRGFIGATATAGYRLTPGETTGLAEVPLTFFPKQVRALQQAFRIREADWQATLDVEALGQSVQADLFHLHSLKAGAAYGSVVVNYFVVGAPASEWRLSLPTDAGNVDVTGQNVGRDWRREGDTLIVPLSRPISGAATLLVTYEQPMNARGGVIAPGAVRALGVQAERGFIHVVSPEQVRHTVSKQDGPLLAIDASELPPEFRVLSNAPTLAAWQYTASGIATAMDVEWYAPGRTVEQAVDLAKLTTRLSRDGEWVTEAAFFVKSAGQPTLRMTLPAGATLWETTIDGETVNTREDEGTLLVPLPTGAGPDRGVEVKVRYGARGSAGSPILAAPVLEAPMVFAEWRVTGDEKRRLIAKAGRAGVVGTVPAQSGWQWMEARPLVAVVLLLLMLAAAANAHGAASWQAWIGCLMLAGTAVAAVILAGLAWRTGVGHATALDFAAPVVAAGEPLVLKLSNVAPWRSAITTAAVLWAVVALALAAAGILRGLPLLKALGVAAAGAAALSLVGGAAWFFLGFALLCGVRLLGSLKNLRRLPGSAAAAATALVFAMLSMAQVDASEVAPVATNLKPAESLAYDWQIADGRAKASLALTVRGKTGDRFLLLTQPAVLSSFDAAGLRVVKAQHESSEAYFVELERDGVVSGRARFEAPIPDPAAGWKLPGGMATQRLFSVRWNEPGWEFVSASAVAVTSNNSPQESSAAMTLAPDKVVVVRARPMLRDAASEETRFFAETRQVFVPGPGVVTGRHLIEIRPAQGRVDALRVQVPAGFTVADVEGKHAGAWRFDADAGELRVSIEPAQEQAFSIVVETQRGTDAPPADLTLAPLRVADAAGDVGLLAIAFGGDTQPENVTPTGLSRVNPEDADRGLLRAFAGDGQPAPVVREAFRYGEAEASLALRVVPVSAELRSEVWQLVSLGEDRLVVSADVDVEITRAGVFRIDVEIPVGLEIESVSGPALGHWSEQEVDGRRLLALHLAGRTIGRQSFAIALAGPSPVADAGSAARWLAPRVSVAGAARETGVLTVVPERGLQVRVESRRNLSQIDARELAGNNRESARAAVRPGALVWRTLQTDWSLELAIDRLDPWVTATVFHDATLREGQVRERVTVTWRIENAAIKTAKLRLPALDETAAGTVRATGPAVADMVRVTDADEPDLWEIRFQRSIAGETTAEIEFQRLTDDAAVSATLSPIELPGARQVTLFVAVRSGGRLDLSVNETPRGWQRADWAVVRAALGHRAGDMPPRMAFRVADAEGPLVVALRRHQLAELRRLRVVDGLLTTLLGPDGASLTAVELDMAAAAQSTLRLQLPEGAELFNVFVNDEGAPLVREDNAWLFHVSPAPDVTRPATVRFVYSSPQGARLEGPVLDVPMENLRWRVLVPDGWRLASHKGDFDLRRVTHLGDDGDSSSKSKLYRQRKEGAGEAAELIDQAGKWMQSGNQELAAAALSNAMRNSQLDEASNEDARVQFRELRTQQAVLGLNTRRQRMVMDNATHAPEADQLQRAASANPLLQGDSNYDPAQFDRMLEGNTAEELTTLREIAARIVSQQLAADPAPAAINPVLPERGLLLEFERGVQAEGDRPMGISLNLRRESRFGGFLAFALCLAVGWGATRKKTTGS